MERKAEMTTTDIKFLRQFRKGLEGLSHRKALTKARRTLRKIRSGPRGIEKHLEKLRQAEYPRGLEKEIEALCCKEAALEQLSKHLLPDDISKR